MTSAKLNSSESRFTDYFAFSCSAMSDCIKSGMLRSRPFGSVICLVAKKLQKFVITIHCEEHFTVVKIFNCLFLAVWRSYTLLTSDIRDIQKCWYSSINIWTHSIYSKKNSIIDTAN